MSCFAPRARAHAWVLVAALAILGLPCPVVPPPACLGEDAPTATRALPEVVLKSGHVLVGRIVAREKTAEGPAVLVQTDLARVLVAESEVERRSGQEPGAPEATFRPRHWWVARIAGGVERQRPPSKEWVPVRWAPGPYGAFVNAPNALIRPGDRVRTGADGAIDLVPHASVWVRVQAQSEIELPPLGPGPASLDLLVGSTLQSVRARPRGETFRLGTPAGVLGVKGTRFGCDVGVTTTVFTSEGIVGLAGGPDVPAGSALDLRSGAPPASRRIAKQERDRLATLDGALLDASDLVLIPGGTYRLTATPAPLDGIAPEKRGPLEYFAASDHTLRTIVLQPFLIERHAFSAQDLAAHARHLQEGTSGLVNPAAVSRMALRPGSSPGTAEEDAIRGMRPTPDLDREGSQPAHAISWLQADLLARWRGRELPTEAQWEAAARGPKAGYWPWGDELRESHAAFLRDAQARLRAGERPLPVTARTLDVSPHGVLGMISSGDTWMLEFADRASVTDGDTVNREPHKVLLREAFSTRRSGHMPLGTPPSWNRGATLRGVMTLEAITEPAGR